VVLQPEPLNLDFLVLLHAKKILIQFDTNLPGSLLPMEGDLPWFSLPGKILEHTVKKPNIIFILIDDLGWKDLSCTGSTFYETPNIDSLCEKGMKFTQGYAACPVCSPSRASIMSGKYPVSTGVTDWIDHTRPSDSPHGDCRGRLIDAPYLDHLPLEEESLATALKKGGYQTWHVGKWHLGVEPYYPQHHGFDVNIGGCLAGSPGEGGYFSPWTIEALRDAAVPDGTYLTDYLTDQTIKVLRERDTEKPFFLNLWYYSVHTPIEAKPEKIKKYEKKAKEMGLDTLQTFEEGDFFPCEHKKTEHISRRLVQSDCVYAAMIESLDENIGRVFEELEKQGMSEDTLIIFTSDNGGLSTAEGSPTCNLPLAEGKGWLYEGGVREPLLISWPGRIKSGSICPEPVSSPDFYPTLLEAAGLPLKGEQHRDGKSLMPLMSGSDTFDREAIFWHYPHYGNQGGTPGSSILMYPWKLIEFYEDMRLELYNIENDPGENTNLANSEIKQVSILKDALHVWQAEVGALFPENNPDFKPWRKDHFERGFQPWD
jgi:arylsulfatase A-like enzyme